MSAITVRLNDVARGRVADGVPVLLERLGPGERQHVISEAVTDSEGRATGLVPPGTPFEAGRFRVTCRVRSYFTKHDAVPLLPEIVIVFDVLDAGRDVVLSVSMTPHGYTVSREP